MFFSPSLNIFVNPALKDDYINVNSWPDDAVEVDEQGILSFPDYRRKEKSVSLGKMVFLHGLKFHHQRMRNRLPQPN